MFAHLVGGTDAIVDVPVSLANLFLSEASSDVPAASAGGFCRD